MKEKRGLLRLIRLLRRLIAVRKSTERSPADSPGADGAVIPAHRPHLTALREQNIRLLSPRQTRVGFKERMEKEKNHTTTTTTKKQRSCLLDLDTSLLFLEDVLQMRWDGTAQTLRTYLPSHSVLPRCLRDSKREGKM